MVTTIENNTSNTNWSQNQKKQTGLIIGCIGCFGLIIIGIIIAVIALYYYYGADYWNNLVNTNNNNQPVVLEEVKNNNVTVTNQPIETEAKPPADKNFAVDEIKQSLNQSGYHYNLKALSSNDDTTQYEDSKTYSPYYLSIIVDNDTQEINSISLVYFDMFSNTVPSFEQWQALVKALGDDFDITSWLQEYADKAAKSVAEEYSELDNKTYNNHRYSVLYSADDSSLMISFNVAL
ncbi:MAG: hypothetical protein WCW27_04585 [Patescibacteria group bacterium]|jgi:hypothetical protein